MTSTGVKLEKTNNFTTRHPPTTTLSSAALAFEQTNY